MKATALKDFNLRGSKKTKGQTVKVSRSLFEKLKEEGKVEESTKTPPKLETKSK